MRLPRSRVLPLSKLLCRTTHLFSRSSIIRTSSTSSATDIPPQPEFAKYEEALFDYRPGGYHPTNLGDILNERYRIRCKLGCGSYSTVWLAHDKKTDKHFSIKILTAETSHTHILQELTFLQHVAKYDPTHPGYSRIIRLQDYFYHEGPHGSHLCLVTEVLAESVHSVSTYTRKNIINVAAAKSITKQVLQGLDYLHKSGIVHTDIKLDNLLVEIPDVEDHIRRAFESSSPTVLPPVENAAGIVINYIPSTPLAIPFEGIKTFKPVNVKIADLGVACWEAKVEEYWTDQIQTPAIRAPEVFVGAGWNSKCDIWSIGCIVFEMLAGRSAIPSGDMDTLEARVLFMLCIFGQFPTELLSRGKYTERYFKPDGSFLYDLPEEAKLVPRYNAHIQSYIKIIYQDEFDRLISFLESTFTMLPENRPTAAELLEHEWFKSETVFRD